MSLTLYVNASQRGLEEKIKIMLAETGLKYDLVPIDANTLQSMHKDGTLNWGKLPALQDGAAIIEDSTNILEYVAAKADAMGKGSGGNKYCGLPSETFQIRAIANYVYDFQMEIKPWLGKGGMPDGAAKAVEKWFTLFQALLDKNDDGDVRTEEWSYGKNFTFADVAIFEAVNAAVAIHGIGTLRPFPKLKEFHDKVASRARIEHHLATRG